MAFTRFHDDPCRVMKQNQQSTDPGRWILDVPGNGLRPDYMADPHIIPQKWGANLWHEFTDVSNELRGLNRRVNRDCTNTDTYKRHTVFAQPLKDTYAVNETLTTEQSRAIAPAWITRETEYIRWNYLLSNPQDHANFLLPFPNNESTRLRD